MFLYSWSPAGWSPLPPSPVTMATSGQRATASTPPLMRYFCVFCTFVCILHIIIVYLHFWTKKSRWRGCSATGDQTWRWAESLSTPSSKNHDNFLEFKCQAWTLIRVIWAWWEFPKALNSSNTSPPPASSVGTCSCPQTRSWWGERKAARVSTSTRQVRWQCRKKVLLGKETFSSCILCLTSKRHCIEVPNPQAVIIACYSEPIVAEQVEKIKYIYLILNGKKTFSKFYTKSFQCAVTTEKLGDYLVSVGY